MATPRPFRPRDLLRESLIQELAISPDGESVAYSRRTIERNAYRTRLWRVRYRGGRAEQLTSGELDARPRFSPDGGTLLFLSKRSGQVQPWLLPLGGGEAAQLAELPGGVSAAEWSPDGRRVLLLGPSGVDRFIVGDRESPVARRIEDLTWRLDGVGARDQHRSLWVVAASGGTPRRLTPPTYDVGAAVWAGAERIAFLADLRPDAALLEYLQAWTIDIGQNPRPRPLLALAGEVLSLAWSDAGKVAAIGVDRPEPVGWENAKVFALEGGRPRVLAEDLDLPASFTAASDLFDVTARSPSALSWLDDDNILALVTDQGRVHPYRFGLDGSVERLAEGPIVCWRLATAAGRIVVVAADRGRPGEVYAIEQGRLRELTRNGSRWLAPYRRDPEHIRVPHPDGHEVDAWLLPGRGRRKRRVVLQVHGGPHLAHSPTPWLEMLALAGAGFSVLYGNPRGSVSYGEDFARSITGDWGEKDASDVLRLADWAVGAGIADPARIGLLGLSYGGFMTNWLLGRHPGRFAAAVSENPVTELIGDWGSWDFPGAGQAHLTGLKNPYDDPARAVDRSPAFRIHQSEAPLLLLQSEGDLRCPPPNSDIVFAILRLLGREVEYVRYPDESHLLLALGRPDRRVDRLERIVDWFARYL